MLSGMRLDGYVGTWGEGGGEREGESQSDLHVHMQRFKLMNYSYADITVFSK